MAVTVFTCTEAWNVVFKTSKSSSEKYENINSRYFISWRKHLTAVKKVHSTTSSAFTEKKCLRLMI